VELLIFWSNSGSAPAVDELVRLAFPDIETRLITSLEAFVAEPAARVSAILLGIDSIQDVTEHLTAPAYKDTLFIQASFRLMEPGAGVRVSALHKPSYLICEIDQSQLDWPTRIIERLRLHEKMSALLLRLSEIFGSSPGSGSPDDLTSTLIWIRRTAADFRPLMGDYIDHWLPPADIKQLMEKAIRADASENYEILISSKNAALRNTNIRDLVALVHQELESLFDEAERLGRKRPEFPLRVLIVSPDSISRSLFHKPFLFFQDNVTYLVFPVRGLSRFSTEPSQQSIRCNIRQLITIMMNYYDRPDRWEGWEWLSTAIAGWYALRDPGEDLSTTTEHDWTKPLDDPDNKPAAISFVEFLEGRLGARDVFRLWREQQGRALEVFWRNGLLEGFFHWLPEAYWDELSSRAQGGTGHGKLDHCSCQIWRPRTTDPLLLKSARTGTVGAFWARNPETGESQDGESDSLLMVYNCGWRRKSGPRYADDEIGYELQTGSIAMRSGSSDL
jgi:hypothetical protein